MIAELIRSLAGLNPALDIFIKPTLLLLAAWGMHAALRHANPRWQILLWRGVGCGMVLIPVLVLLMPKIVVPVRLAPKVVDAEEMTNPRLGSSTADVPDSLFEEPMQDLASPAGMEIAQAAPVAVTQSAPASGVSFY